MYFDFIYPTFSRKMKIINIAQKIGHPQFAKSFASGIVGSKAFGQITGKYGEHYYNILLLLIFLTNDFVEKYKIQIEEILKRGLSIRKENRYQKMASMIKDVEKFSGGM